MLQVLEPEQGQEEEVARATRRVQDTELLQPVEETLIQLQGGVAGLGSAGGGPGRLGLIQVALDLRLDRHPFRPEGIEDHGVDQAHDGGGIGVLRPQLGAQGRVETAHEQGAGDRRVDGLPIEGGQGQQGLDIRQFQGQGIGDGEEAAVEPVDLLETDQAAGGHGAEEGFELTLGLVGMGLGRL